MKFRILILGMMLVAAACGGSPEVGPSTTAAAQSTTTSAEATTTHAPAPATTTTLPRPADVDLVTYVAAMEDVLAGTLYEGEALASPEVFLATGSLFCDQLDGGMTPDEVLTQYLEALTGGSAVDASEDDLTMAGGVLGVGVVTLCPRHIDTVATSS